MPVASLIKALGSDSSRCDCCGGILDVRKAGSFLRIEMQTAWNELRCLRMAIESAYPSLKVYCLAEELGDDVYVSNDREGRFFRGRYLIDSSLDIYERFETLDELKVFVERVVGHSVECSLTQIEEALDDYSEQQDDDDCWFSLHEIEYDD